jgi:hypothetical protein
MVTARARAGYGARQWARGRPGRASAERFAASQRHQRRCPFEASSGAEEEGAPTRERRRRNCIDAARRPKACREQESVTRES